MMRSKDLCLLRAILIVVTLGGIVGRLGAAFRCLDRTAGLLPGVTQRRLREGFGDDFDIEVAGAADYVDAAEV